MKADLAPGRIVGVDPGRKGGIALIDEGRIVETLPIPHLGKNVDCLSFGGQLVLWRPSLVVVELQQIRGGQSGAMTLGSNYGRILATLEIGGWPHRVTSAQAWKKRMGVTADKGSAFAAARRVWGAAFNDLALGASKDGQVEALLIAWSVLA